jgi:hypothetical protein
MDFDYCASAARHLKNSAEEAHSVEREYQSTKSNYESAYSSYGYGRGDMATTEVPVIVQRVL